MLTHEFLQLDGTEFFTLTPTLFLFFCICLLALFFSLPVLELTL